MTTLLNGKRIVVTRSTEQAQEMGCKLAAFGAIPVYFPAIQLVSLPAVELDEAVAQLATYDWLVFTSGNAVRCFFNRLDKDTVALLSQRTAVSQIAAVGSATVELLAEKGITVDFVPKTFTGEQLAAGLADVRNKRVLLPRAKIGRPEIVDLLKERGAIVTEIGLYDTITAVPTPKALADLEEGADVLTFTSPSSVRNFYKILADCPLIIRQQIDATPSACIGPSTAAELANLGRQAAIVPEAYTIDGLVTAVVDYFAAG